jgi:porphobilinogen synthase
MRKIMLQRPRRNRKSPAIRALVEETQLTPSQLIQPIFVRQGTAIQEPIKTLPGSFRLSIDKVLAEVETCLKLGISVFDVFPVVAENLKDKQGTYSYHADNFYLDCIAKIKQNFPEACVMTDVALDPYSSDGHDGIYENGKILNDETLPILANMALAQAQAGADIIGPSDMMDGRVGYIRTHLDKHNYQDVSILSYTAKYASAFYGPFRDALDSAPKHGDKKTYQMSYTNAREALREMELDTAEGADMLMVKPALCYLDIIQLLRQNSHLPIVAYNVSGECAMIHFAAQAGFLDYERAVCETLLSIKRAGADAIITYFAKDYATWYKQK